MATKANPNNDQAPVDVFKINAEAEAATRALVAESEAGLTNRCPECGSLGSLEEDEETGEKRCIDCNVSIANVSRLGGLGRK